MKKTPIHLSPCLSGRQATLSEGIAQHSAKPLKDKNDELKGVTLSSPSLPLPTSPKGRRNTSPFLWKGFRIGGFRMGKKGLVSIVLTALFLLPFGKVGMGYAQTYHRIKIQTGKDGLVQLAKLGVAVDHGVYKKETYFIGEFSDNEVNLIKQTGLPYQVLISDLSSYYANRSKASAKITATASSCKDCQNYPVPANFTLGTMGGFYTYQEYLNIVDSMAAKYPNLISARHVIDTSHTWEGRSVFWLRISNNPNVNQSKPQVLYTAIHHAREPESLVELIYYMWYLLENYNTNAEVKYLVDNLEMYFVPCVNPDGYIYNYTTNPNGGGMWRKNRRNNGDGTYGVDLNRNYSFLWGYDNIGSSPTTSNDTYRGPSPASEPEIKMMQGFCNAHTFKLAVNGHTYSDLLIAPDSAGITVPDSTLYNDFFLRMTFCDEFGYGNSMQTVGYSTNGDSDSWMYGEKTTKPKIFAMTPETGSPDDGFWPVTANITPLAENVMDQNMYAARLTAVYADVQDVSGPFISQSGFVKYNIQRLGLQPGTFSVSITPVGSSFQNVGVGNTYSSMTELQTSTDSISFTLVNGLAAASVVKFLLNVNNGGYTHTDTITRVFGTPVVAFADNCNTTAQWTGTWGIDTVTFHSPTGSITDSPVGDYATNANTKTTTVSNINLTDAIAAYLQFETRWEVERGYDYVEIQASTDGITFTPLCGKYSHTGDSYQDFQKPLYDGIQDAWLHETINLSAYLGQNIKLRFNLVSDAAVVYDGLHFDDITVKKIVPTGAGINQLGVINDKLRIYPNPANTSLTLTLSKGEGTANVEVYNTIGERVYSSPVGGGKEVALAIDVSDLAEGVYFVHVQSNDINYVQKFIISR
ncbi:MAG: M14 family zinc carboxypeptidase [Bacteroidia bacterium]